MRILGAILLAMGLPLLLAQIPPPGIGYPRDQGRLPVPRPSRKKSGGTAEERKAPLRVYRGKISSISADKLELESEDGQNLEFTCDKDTKYFRAGQEAQLASVNPGSEVTIEGRQDDRAFLFAVNVTVDKDAPKAAKAEPGTEPAKTAEAEPEPSPATEVAPDLASRPRDPDDPGPPALHRGKPVRVARAESQPEAEPPAPATAAVAQPHAAPPEPVAETAPAEDGHIVKAREAAESFTESLPNYIVQQFTTRYWSESSKGDWKAQDVLSAEVVYMSGKESYRNIRIDNKPVKKSMMELPGSVSHGEFGSTLADVLSRGTDAHFARRGSSRASGRAAWKYDFRVDKPNSHWTTRFGGHTLLPAYSGSVWIDSETFRVMRIEMQARDIPEEFPLDAVEWVVDYGNVRIGGSEFVVPTHAENMACLRGSSRCSRNATDFRNYRRFTAESQIYTTDSTVDFGKEVPEPPPAAKPKQ